MEMKRKQTHILNRCSNRGFTMIELLVAMVVSLLAMAAIYSTFLAQHRSYQVQNETADMQQNIKGWPCITCSGKSGWQEATLLTRAISASLRPAKIPSPLRKISRAPPVGTPAGPKAGWIS